MGYLTSKEAADAWGISSRRVIKLAREGRIAGAHLYGKTWLIPGDAEKPADARRRPVDAEKPADARRRPGSGAKQGAADRPAPVASPSPSPAQKSAAAQDAPSHAVPFRYPTYAFADPAAFDPPLSAEELQLKAVLEAFHACRYEEAERLFGSMPETAADPFIRTYSLYLGCMIDIMLGKTSRYLDRYGRLEAALRGNIPHKPELQELPRELDAFLGKDDYFVHGFAPQPIDAYDASFLPHLGTQLAVSLSLASEQGVKTTEISIRTAELACSLLDEERCPTESQAAHIYLGSAYEFAGMHDDAARHLKAAFALAEKHGALFHLASPCYYLKDLVAPTSVGLPQGFSNQVIAASKDAYARCLSFTKKIDGNGIYQLLPAQDYILVYYAAQGLTNDEVAGHLHLSASAVSKRYGGVCAAANVKTKRELARLYHASICCDSK